MVLIVLLIKAGHKNGNNFAELPFSSKKNYYSLVARPTIIILFGATGDLTAKKIAPALFHLYAKKRLPKKLAVVGFSRRRLHNKRFQEYIRGLVKKGAHIKVEKDTLASYLALFSYQQGNFKAKKDYLKLADYLKKLEKNWHQKANKLFYLAVPPTLYAGIFEHLSQTKLARRHKGTWNRIVVEKPFGNDLKTAEKLDEVLGKLFAEDQIYRIDHYLGKELLQNILAFRFSNNLLEHSWNNKLIESIEVTLSETSGVEDDRGDSYDPVGALRDVGQNHLLQMLALVTMDNPRDLSAAPVRKNRAKILEDLKLQNEVQIKKNTFRAQYKGYTKVHGVPDYSQTETHFKIKGEFKAPRWKGVFFTLESGKLLPQQRKEIVITFKHPSPCLCPTGTHYKNKIIFSLEPKEKITIIFWAKKPGLDMEIEERALDFSYRREHERDEQQTAAYEKLLLDCLTGDQTLFVSTEEVRAMWKFIDPVICAWEKNLVPLVIYRPKEAPATSISCK